MLSQCRDVAKPLRLVVIKKIFPPLARREVPELVTQTAHNTVIRNPNQSLNNNVFSFSSQHQPPRRCGATSIDGDGKGAPAVDSEPSRS